MLYVYLIPSFLTGIITFSWYSFSGFNFFSSLSSTRDNFSPQELKSRDNVPVYMWDIYKSGIGGDFKGADVVKSVTPKILGPFFRNRFYPNHGKQEVEFAIPEPINGETLVNAEVRLMTNQIRALNVTFHLFQKTTSWVYLDSKTVPQDGDDWISLTVISNTKEFNIPPGKTSFLVLSAFQNFEKGFRLLQFLQPVLLLYYRSQLFSNGSISNPSEIKRRKRHLQEDYEEETNRIWDSDGKHRRSRNTCRRKPLYIEFSEINYDKWIVAPTGYEAFQCVGKCTFPVSDNLSPTKHAIVQTLMHHVAPSKAVRACCVPTRLEPISVLYIDNEGILTYRFHYQDMVVAECGCR